ncbi:ferredoxin--NADP reductase [Mameliella sp. AT18]|uniref:ferredoxin--NADP reductase n=1 Tax=Mameliella sp. AT18 TaxID=3028385 RepID=UPI0008410C5E|nr:ferredoxin--NADP reductase [Mameliella sp. AT18]MDD9730337.1 ferredoxin--NADP reductase [Mameliella sp. AT18]ODM49520.1 ferredoxin--NADP(+) reductase [Ruegeria sp. PBVC088]
MNIATPAKILPDAQTVTAVTHWSDTLFSFRVTRPRSLRFRSGEFVMIGLMQADAKTGREKPLLRAYSIASPSWDDELEFYSIKVPDGPLTSRLQKIESGDQLILRPKPVGTLVLDALLPGKRLWMICTGTGIAPFASLLRDPETWESYDQVIVAHTCRTRAELAYGAEIVSALPDDPLIGELVGDKLRYYPTTTRDPSDIEGRISDHIRDGRVFAALDLPAWTPEEDRVMICGNLALNKDIIGLCEAHGLEEGANSAPRHFVVEKAFLD